MDWQLIHDSTHTAEIVNVEKNYTAIKKIVVRISKKILIVQIISTTAKSNWSFGGYITIRSDIPDFIGTEESDFKRPCILNGSTRVDLTRLPLSFFDDYPHFIVLKIPYWIKQAQLKVWEYKLNIPTVLNSSLSNNMQNISEKNKTDGIFINSGIFF